MIVYADRHECVSTRDFVRTTESASDPLERRIRQGQFEAAVMDEVCPEVDDEVDLTRVNLPERLRIRPVEGFAWYALYPEQYTEAARRFVRECQPCACVVIGIRSIGTTLSNVVADALPCPVWRFTVRPHGHPFDRELRLSPALEQRIGEHASDWFLVVDEGPGLSGSSMASVAEKLSELGIPNQRIVFFPAHEPDVSCFCSEKARRRWPRHKIYASPFTAQPAGARDLSSGLWRELVGSDAPVHPWHERRKYLKDGVLWKFAGLGHYGRALLERARTLASFTPQPLGLENGFLLSEWVEGTPATGPDEDLLETMASYLAFLAERFDTGTPPDYPALQEMIRVNTGRESHPPDAPSTTVALDGRMLPYEWIRTVHGWRKTDALDHHNDHFFPGCQDIAWDIAGASVEFDIPIDSLAASYLRLRPDATLSQRLPFYRTAYLAYRIGYTDMAAGDSPDADRFRSLNAWYLRAL